MTDVKVILTLGKYCDIGIGYLKDFKIVSFVEMLSNLIKLYLILSYSKKILFYILNEECKPDIFQHV